MSRVFIIAEAGVNHNGDVNLAKELIKCAKEAGADAVKFQTFRADRIVCRNTKKAQYQIDNMQSEESQLEMLKSLELNQEKHEILDKYSREQGILFLSSPFDLESITLLEELGMPLYKIPSGEITNYPLIVEIAKTGKPVILSTGMSTLSEIEEAISVLRDNGTTKLSLLHCNTQYPTPMEDVNLRAMETLNKQFMISIGYSDHTEGIEIAIAAAALGASIIEKHFTLDKTMKGPDHKASVSPQELKNMINAIRNIELALGQQIKKPSPSEKINRNIARKSIVARVDIKKGEILTAENMTVKRPGNGITPMKWKEVIGTRAIREFAKDTEIIVKDK